MNCQLLGFLWTSTQVEADSFHFVAERPLTNTSVNVYSQYRPLSCLSTLCGCLSTCCWWWMTLSSLTDLSPAPDFLQTKLWTKLDLFPAVRWSFVPKTNSAEEVSFSFFTHSWPHLSPVSWANRHSLFLFLSWGKIYWLRLSRRLEFNPAECLSWGRCRESFTAATFVAETNQSPETTGSVGFTESTLWSSSSSLGCWRIVLDWSF